MSVCEMVTAEMVNAAYDRAVEIGLSVDRVQVLTLLAAAVTAAPNACAGNVKGGDGCTCDPGF